MKAWLIYFKERFPLPVYLLLTGGIVFSGYEIQRGAGDASSISNGYGFVLGVAWAAIGLLVFFCELRLMDERKDFEKDLIAHPTRPLPRGVLGTAEVDRAIQGIALLMAAFGLLLLAVANLAAALLYFLVTGYLWLMYREFYLGQWLSGRPILYAITHQIILLPVCAFAAMAASRSGQPGPELLPYSVTVLGSFFTYEVCRKLDPASNPVLKTYLLVYGRAGTSALVLGTTLVAASSACALGLRTLLWPLELLVLLSLVTVLFKFPTRYKLVEGVATLSLLGHLYSGAAKILFGGHWS